MRLTIRCIKSIIAVCLLMAVNSCSSTRSSRSEKNVILLDTVDVTVPRENPYRASATRYFDLIHTRLEVSFDWQHQWMYGKEYLSLTPHFYAQRKVVLDAKHMDIYKVEELNPDGVSKALPYSADSLKLTINLDREYKRGDTLRLFFSYKAKPNEHRSTGSDAIQDDKGLYFINPLGTDSSKPMQIWTQGETESNSNWFITFDKPNFRSTEEIYITVDKKFSTLSNGLLVSQKNNEDGTRTDYWKMDLPHPPYLFMMAIGEFEITRDKWRDREVSYYAEKKYAPYTRRIFGETPDMMEYFSKILAYNYPWPKYAQVVVRDYVSGAMENTSATLHGENLNRTPRQLLDEDYHDYISHELFHQWFGDLVTCESWSNITLNESFADYSEYLWNEHRYGREHADYIGRLAFDKYMNDSRRGKNFNLVRYHYDDREEVFDTHSYEKGGRILHMLRYAVGDSAFFKSLNVYLKNNAFHPAEVAQLRLAFEEVTGRDMNWFFNQWYFNEGHPIVHFDYSYTADSIFVKVSQQHNTEKPLTYELPFRIDIHYGDRVDSNEVVLKKMSQTFAFAAKATPDLIDGDAERVLLCERSENKTLQEYIFQFRHAANYLQKREALDSLRKYQRLDYSAMMLYREALKDHSIGIRIQAAKFISVSAHNRDTVLPLLQTVLENEAVSKVRSALVETIGKQKEKDYEPLLLKYTGDSSYMVSAAALSALGQLDSAKALAVAHDFEKDHIFEMKNAVYSIYSANGDSSYNGFFIRKLAEDKGYSRAFLMYYYANYLCRMDLAIADSGIGVLQAALSNEDENGHQLHGFGSGSIERIKDYFEREKNIYAGILGADRKTRAKYDLTLLKSREDKLEKIIRHAKDAIAALKKSK